jgi:predicted metal-dependent enzyme (double-stranded beta helix superfamily)
MEMEPETRYAAPELPIKRPSKESPYRLWEEAEGIPIYRGSAIPDLYTLEVALWPRLGQKGAFVNLADQEHDDAHLVELSPGGQTEVQRHIYESLIYVLDGRGATTIWQPGGEKQTVEWQRGSIFSPPLNAYYQHFNLDGTHTARLFAVTTAPMMINTIVDTLGRIDFVFDNPFVFDDRFNSEADYFLGEGKRIAPRIEWQTNYIADARIFKLDPKPERGQGSSNMHLYFANNYRLVSHISEWPVGTYMKGHRHGAGAHVLILDGIGYSLLWFEGQPRQKVDWQDGAVLSPQDWEYHQHFNTGTVPTRYLAFRCPGTPRDHESGLKSGGPDQIERPDEDPAIYDEYVADCARNGVEVTLPRPNYRTPASAR